jgi:transposase InsO family protein
MTTVQAGKIARRKLTLLQLAQELGNVSKACKIVGYSRQQFYEIRRNFQSFGAEGLVDRVAGPRNPHPNRVSPEVETAILDYALEHPTYGPQRTADELLLRGTQVSAGGVRGVWGRHSLLTKHERLLRLEEFTRKKKVQLTDEQIRLLERFSPEFRERHIETRFTGDLVAVDTFFVGTLKGVGKVYLQTVLDCFSRYTWARFYTSKLPVTAVHVLNEDVLPFFEGHGARVHTILSDNGREFCGRPDQHPYELFLQLEEIEHRTTKVRRPQSNGFIERFHRTLLDEHLRPAGRTKWYESVEEMQTDLNVYLERYNTQRPHRGRGMKGRSPEQVFLAGIPRPSSPPEQEVAKAA